MKKSHLRVVSWIFVGSFAWLSSCVKEDNDDCAKQCDVLIVKAIDSDSESVKDNVGVYLFDENLKLEKTINSKLDTNINIERASTKKYTAVCLARTADSPLPIIPLGTSIDQAQLVLQRTNFAGIPVATSPTDLFYGKLELSGTAACDEKIAWVKRKVAALTIITRNLQSALHTTDTDFTYLVTETYDALDFSGTLKGNRISYHPASYFNITNKDLIAPIFYTYSSANLEGFCISIFRGTNLLRTYCADKEEAPLLLQEGKLTVVLIDYVDDNNNGALNVTVRVLNWGDTNIDEGFN